MKTEMMDRIGALSGKATMGVGAAGALWGWITVERIFSAIGVLIGVAGLLVTWYYKREANKRHKQAAELQAQLLRERLALLRRGASPEALRLDSDLMGLEKMEADE